MQATRCLPSEKGCRSSLVKVLARTYSLMNKRHVLSNPWFVFSAHSCGLCLLIQTTLSAYWLAFLSAFVV